LLRLRLVMLAAPPVGSQRPWLGSTGCSTLLLAPVLHRVDGHVPVGTLGEPVEQAKSTLSKK